jgi:hypothetical protein
MSVVGLEEHAIMSDITYETLREHVLEHLTVPVKEFGRTVGEISRNFRNLGFETATWYPERIHTTNLGGIIADSYLGYSRVEGRWGLIIRTIERDQESRTFVGQRVYPIESCGNLEIIVSGLKKARDLLLCISKVADQQIEILKELDGAIEPLRNPDCKF